LGCLPYGKENAGPSGDGLGVIVCKRAAESLIFCTSDRHNPRKRLSTGNTRRLAQLTKL